MEDIYTLRFKVYCKERHFLRSEEYPDGRELDKYDRYSVHFAAYNRLNDVVGAVRLVRPPRGKPFPYAEFCAIFPDIVLPPNKVCAEVSRLVVSPPYRRPKGATIIAFSSTMIDPRSASPLGAFTQIGERRTPSTRIVMGLYRNIYRYSKQKGITHLYAAMEKSLGRILTRYGFPFQPIGPEVDYYGPVTPYLLDMAKLDETLAQSHPEVLEWFQKSSSSLKANTV